MEYNLKLNQKVLDKLYIVKLKSNNFNNYQKVISKDKTFHIDKGEWFLSSSNYLKYPFNHHSIKNGFNLTNEECNNLLSLLSELFGTY